MDEKDKHSLICEQFVAGNEPAVIAGIAAGVLLVGFVVFSPLGQINLGAQAQSTGVTKKVTLIADE